MKLQLKRSSTLESGAAKEPTTAQMEFGELAINFNSADPCIFLKDSGDNIVRIAGDGSAGGGIDASNVGNGLDFSSELLTVKIQAGYGIQAEAAGLRIGDDWSSIPALS